MTQELGFRNNGYKSDVDYVVKVARTLLTPIGIWPLYRGDSLSDKIKMYIQISLIFGLMCCLLIPHLIYTYFDAEKLIKEMKVIAAQVFSTLAIVKFWTVIINRKEIGYCLLEMERQYKEVECQDDLMVMVKSAKIGRLFTIAYLSLSYGGALPYHIILPLVAEPIVKDDNTTMLPLPYLSDYIFFVVETSPIFEIFFVGQIFVSSIILSTNCGVYSLIASCVMHSCCLFEVVRRQIDTIFQYDNEDNLRKRIYVIVDNHLQAIRYAEKIEQALNIVFLCEMVGCTIIICFLEFGVLVDWEDKETLGMMTYGVLMTSIFVNVFIISYIGDRLKEESELVGESTYSIEWYRLPNTIISDLVMIIVRSNRPSRLTAGKIFDVSLQGFCDVCKTSAAYLNFLRTMVA